MSVFSYLSNNIGGGLSSPLGLGMQLPIAYRAASPAPANPGVPPDFQITRGNPHYPPLQPANPGDGSGELSPPTLFRGQPTSPPSYDFPTYDPNNPGTGDPFWGSPQPFQPGAPNPNTPDFENPGGTPPSTPGNYFWDPFGSGYNNPSSPNFVPPPGSSATPGSSNPIGGLGNLLGGSGGPNAGQTAATESPGGTTFTGGFWGQVWLMFIRGSVIVAGGVFLAGGIFMLKPVQQVQQAVRRVV